MKEAHVVRLPDALHGLFSYSFLILFLPVAFTAFMTFGIGAGLTGLAGFGSMNFVSFPVSIR